MAVERTVIVGSGHAGVEVAASLRDGGYEGEIHLVGEEVELPYQRPPLSKHPQRAGDATMLPLRPASFYTSRAVHRASGERVLRIDRPHRRVLLASGGHLDYERLVLALGSSARRPAVPGADGARVHELRSYSDACRLWHALASARSLAVVGGGFLGLEFAAAARARGVAVTVIEVAPRLLASAVSAPVAAVLERAHVQSGTDLVLDDSVSEIVRRRDTLVGVTTAAGRRVPADLVLVAVGAQPRTDLAASAGLAVDDGILVDPSMRTSDPSIFAVGDCARVRHADGRSHRIESVASAVATARTAARSITGDDRVRSSPLWFWSEQGASMLQIAGIAGREDDVVAHVDTPGQITALRFRGDDLVCVETVNRPRDHVRARRLLGDRGSVSVDRKMVYDLLTRRPERAGLDGSRGSR
ncbi:NAD(P)/FAD-dependent oxidoreductase [Desertimonas flava]|uniref:NAD(P)/FAD-dependent oxidoreductase n=1 Tax=Desertimonas flava TaxID=2064846 RepID=UPI000E347FCF|nr:FAD-dependent oxidoreductase [Desertimonas flava]